MFHTVWRHVFCQSLSWFFCFFCLIWMKCSGLWTGHSLSSSIRVWRTWLKQRSSSTPHRHIRSITTSLQRGWNMYLHWNSQRLVSLLTAGSCSVPLECITFFIYLFFCFHSFEGDLCSVTCHKAPVHSIPLRHWMNSLSQNSESEGVSCSTLVIIGRKNPAQMLQCTFFSSPSYNWSIWCFSEGMAVICGDGGKLFLVIINK